MEAHTIHNSKQYCDNEVLNCGSFDKVFDKEELLGNHMNGSHCNEEIANSQGIK